MSAGENLAKVDNYYPLDYNAIHESYESMEPVNGGEAKRFVKYEERERQSVLTSDMFNVFGSAIDKINWNGVEVLKGPLEIVIMNDFLYQERPQTVIELGSFTGGCALWMADALKCFGVKSHIYSVDYNFDNLHERTKHRDDITFIQGDLREIEQIFPEKMLKALPHPWFINEDSHVYFDITLAYLDKFTQPGDYLVVEDTHPNMHTRKKQGVDLKVAAAEALKGLDDFMKTHSDRYRVDCRYTDFFGYNASRNLNGFLKRI